MLPIPAEELNGSGTLGPYWTFYRAVAAEQLNRWLPSQPSVILDLSGGRGRWSGQAARAGHRVIEVLDFRRTVDAQSRLRDADRVRHVRADDLSFLPDESVDAVLAEERAMSVELMAESAMSDVARVLRPGGRALVCVDSLVLGMAILAEQGQWQHLRQTGEVMLVPWPDGSITRCFSSGQLRELLAGTGLEVEWMRPRTVLSPSTVDHVLSSDARALSYIVRTELEAHPDDDDTVGIHLVASARKR
ncbi:class I SAM-dependent methyltransferase [Nonomuraea sp. KC401]|uniref:class I SAM-dependent methyltransferase n=1 Tax=unclassified Nonomuraea TaxID=2593643 RepID=UPI0010FD0B3A|nr:methyltransferase domain-containing protein [Nonomuraea sp. KC401]NBE98489.1 methyltransferase domain-containing protein [Nonomuraea sp. K271]TLF83240.1 class I SAM-dependent methyltransferase [Nonomuraea sp. KC401]